MVSGPADCGVAESMPVCTDVHYGAKKGVTGLWAISQMLCDSGYV